MLDFPIEGHIFGTTIVNSITKEPRQAFCRSYPHFFFTTISFLCLTLSEKFEQACYRLAQADSVFLYRTVLYKLRQDLGGKTFFFEITSKTKFEWVYALTHCIPDFKMHACTYLEQAVGISS